MADIERFSLLGRLGFPLYHKWEEEGFPADLDAPDLAPTNYDNWLVKELGATEVTDAYIQVYQKAAIRNFPGNDTLQENFGYNPTQSYLQLEANIVASMPYLPTDPQDADETDRKVFMDDRHFKLTPKETIYEEWYFPGSYEVGDIIYHPYAKSSDGHPQVVKVKTAYTSSWATRNTQAQYFEDTPIAVVPDKDDLVWKAGTAFVDKQLIRQADPTTGVIHYWVSNSARTTGTTFDDTEKTNWTEIMPAYMWAFRLTERGLHGGSEGHYPESWTKEQILTAPTDEQKIAVIRLIRMVCDVLNGIRWYILTKSCSRNVFRTVEGVPVVSKETFTEEWFPGIGKHIYPRLAILLGLRNVSKNLVVYDLGTNGSWTNIISHFLDINLGDFDVFGSVREGKEIYEYAEERSGHSGTFLSRGAKMSIGRGWMAEAWTPGSHAEERIIESTSGGISLNEEYVRLTKIVAEDDSFSKLDATQQEWLRQLNHSTDIGSFMHEMFGHGFFGVGHTGPNGDGTDYQKALKELNDKYESFGYESPASYDLAYLLSTFGNNGPAEYLRTEVLHFILEDPDNRDYFGKRFSEYFGLDLVYKKPVTTEEVAT